MKFFTKSRYALRLMIELAQHSPEENISLKYISEKQNISLKYLEQIIVLLTRAGLVRSVRGSQGGYKLAEPPEQCTAGDILRAIEGSLAPVECLDKSGKLCERRSICRAIAFWKGMNDCLDAYADSVTLKDLASDCEPAAFSLKPLKN